MDYLNVNPVTILNLYENSDWIQNFVIKNDLKLKLHSMAQFGRKCNKAGIPAHPKNKQKMFA